jgi:cysteine desulfurase family protein
MIYFDNAATTLIKPEEVYKAVMKGMRKCANAGRGGHKPSAFADRCVFECRVAVAELFGVDRPEKVVFMQNATYALNTAIKSIVRNEGNVLITGYEHNSVVRPLESMKENGVTYRVVKSKLFDKCELYNAFKCELEKGGTSCVVVSHISNVFGYEIPIDKIDELCLEHNIPLVLDLSQSAGTMDINLSKFKSVAYACMPGHKSLFGPQGTGILICCKDKYLYSIIQGGTGSNSYSFKQPDYLPDVYESGTLNVPGICGLAAGISFIKRIGLVKIKNKHKSLLNYAKEGLNCLDRVHLFTDSSHEHGILSFAIEGLDSEEVCSILSRFDICVRGGLHCSPLAHQNSNTSDTGLIRLSFSVFNSLNEIEKLVYLTKKYVLNRS